MTTLFDFADDERVFFFSAILVGCWGLFVWYQPLFRHSPLRKLGPRSKELLLASPVICLTVAGLVIWRWSDPVAVAGHVDYWLLFVAGAAAWLALTRSALAAVGLDVRHDVVETGNKAAVAALTSTMLATTLIYTAGNMGAGPTIWTTILPAALGSATLAGLWLLLVGTTSLADAITIDRDQASGIRTAGWVVGTSIILGRAVAGDWTSWSDTFSDFVRLGWPAALLTAGAIPLQLAWRPTPERPRPSRSTAAVVALAFVLAAVQYVVSLPAPEIGEHIITYEDYLRSR